MIQISRELNPIALYDMSSRPYSSFRHTHRQVSPPPPAQAMSRRVWPISLLVLNLDDILSMVLWLAFLIGNLHHILAMVLGLALLLCGLIHVLVLWLTLLHALALIVW
jgi:hypothetical protein